MKIDTLHIIYNGFQFHKAVEHWNFSQKNSTELYRFSIADSNIVFRLRLEY